MRVFNPVRKVKYCRDDRRAKEFATMIQNSGHILRYCGYHRYTATERAFENRATKGGYPQEESWSHLSKNVAVDVEAKLASNISSKPAFRDKVHTAHTHRESKGHTDPIIMKHA